MNDNIEAVRRIESALRDPGKLTRLRAVMDERRRMADDMRRLVTSAPESARNPFVAMSELLGSAVRGFR